MMPGKPAGAAASGLLGSVLSGASATVLSAVGDLILALAEGKSIDAALGEQPMITRVFLTSEQIKGRLPILLMLIEKGFINVEEIRKWRSSES